MLKKNKKFTLLLSGLSGALLVSSAAGVALSSCSTTSSSSSSDVQYSYVIDWNNEDAVKRLIIDDRGLVYSDNAMTTVIAVSPKVKLTNIKIPSRVKSILGYSKVMYKDSNGNLTDQAPTTGTYTKVYQSYGAFQNMESLETVSLESGSQLQSIGGAAFSGCTNLKNISGLSNSLKYIGNSAFKSCTNLQAIDISNVVKVDDYAFYSCSNLSSVDLSSALSIGNFAFQNCFSLSSLGSLNQVSTIGTYAFASSTKKGSNISLKLGNLKTVPTYAFYGTQGISEVDFSNNTLLTAVSDNAFASSTATKVDFTGCSSLSSIGQKAFISCTSLTDVYLPSNDITSLTTIGSSAFSYCSSLSTIGVKGTNASSFVATNKLSTLGAYFLANTPIATVDLSNFIPNNSSTNNGTPLGSAVSLAYIPNLSSVTLPSTLTTLNAGLFYASGLSSTNGFSLTLPSSITNIQYTNSLPITTPDNTLVTVSNATPFTNSGIAFIDMSKITSYQSASGSETTIPSYLFNGATKLTSVVLKSGTTVISNNAFQGTTALTSITYPASSNTTPSADVANGFIASADLQTIGTDAFNGAFSATANVTVDLSAMNFTTTPVAFSGSNVVNLKLPTTTTTIAANSFDKMTKLATVNFSDLTKLATIYKSNFTNTQLTSIDLSNTVVSYIRNDSNAGTNSGATGQLFTGLPTTCVVSLPSTIGNFNGVFLDTSGNAVTFSYPNGISADLFTITSGVLTFKSTTNQSLLTNVNTMNLSNLTSATSIGTSTFFGNEKLSSLTLPASVSSFAAGSSITASTNNTTNPTSSYVTANVPFGNNAFTTLNYTGFTSTTGAADTNIQKALFNTTSAATWTAVANIINSLSYQAYPTSLDVAKTLKANMSEWAEAAGGNQVMNTNAASTFSASTSVVLTNSYASTTDTSTSGVTIAAEATTATIVHNGITWTYTNDGTNIKLTGKVNMYKASNSTKNYLVFFNQTTYSATGSDTTICYVPSSTPVNVTLTIATKASSN